MKTYSIAYRVGTYRDCQWLRDPRRFATRQEAVAAAIQIERERKQKSLVYDTASLDAIGAPVGWDCDNEFGDEATVSELSDPH